MKFLWIYFQLLESWQVNDVNGAPIIYPDTTHVEPFYREHDD